MRGVRPRFRDGTLWSENGSLALPDVLERGPGPQIRLAVGFPLRVSALRAGCSQMKREHRRKPQRPGVRPSSAEAPYKGKT